MIWIESRQDAHMDKIKAVLKVQDNKQLEAEYQHVMEAREGDITEATISRDSIASELTTIEAQIKLNRDSLKKKQREEKNAEQSLMGVMEIQDKDKIDDYPNKVTQLENNLRDSRRDLASFSQRQLLAKKAVEIGERKRCCRLCRRGFEDEDEFASFMDKMRKEAELDDRAKLEEEIEGFSENLEQLKNVASDYELLSRLKSVELPQITNELNRLNKKKEMTVSSLEERDALVAEKTSAKREVESVRSFVTGITQYQSQVEEHERQIRSLESQLKASGSSRTVEEIQQVIQAYNEQENKLRNLIEEIRLGKDMQLQQIRALEARIQQHNMDLSDAQAKFDRKQELMRKVTESGDAVKANQERISTADTRLKELTPELAASQAKSDDLQKRADANEKELQELTNGLSDSLRGLSNIALELNHYEDQGGLQKLDQAVQQAAALQQKVKDQQKMLDEISKSLTAAREKQTDAEKHRRVVNDNLRLRQYRKEIEGYRAKVKELESHNVYENRATYARDYTIASKKLADITAAVRQIFTPSPLDCRVVADM